MGHFTSTNNNAHRWVDEKQRASGLIAHCGFLLSRIDSLLFLSSPIFCTT